MMKIYVLPNGKKYWYEEGTQPSNAIELKKEVKKEVTKEVQEKVVEPKNKVVKTTKRK